METTELFFAAIEGGFHEFVVSMVELVTAHGGRSAKKALLESTRWDGWTPLLLAISRGHVRIVEYLVKQGASVIRKRHNGFDALLMATTKNQTRVVEFLLKHGADVNSHNDKQWTALMMASKKASMDIIRVLLKAGANINARAYDGLTALHIAACCGCVENQDGKQSVVAPKKACLDVVRVLLKAGGDLTARADEGESALYVAANFGLTEVVKILVEAGADASLQDHKGATALTRAVCRGHVDVVKCLLEHGADDESTEDQRATLLIVAIELRHTQVVQALLAHRALHSAVVNGHSALQAAVNVGDEGILRLLTQHGADVLWEPNEGQTAFFSACANGKINLVIAMVEEVKARSGDQAKIAMLDSPRRDGATPLMMAAIRGHVDTVKYLIKSGASVKHVGDGDADALRCAAQEGYARIVEQLLMAGSDVDHTNFEGETALMIASARGHEEVVRVLIKGGARLDARSHANTTALSAACGKGHTAVVLTLLDGLKRLKEGDVVQQIVNLQRTDGVTPLILASMSCDPEVVRALLDHGAELELQSDDPIGGTAIFYASQHGMVGNVKLLIERGANVNAQGYDGYTALITAVDSGHSDVCRLLLARGADMTRKTGEGYTALHRAVHFSSECLKVLIAARVDVNLQDDEGLTAIYAAALNGRFDVVKSLESLPGAVLLDEGKASRTWPLSALFDLYEKPLGQRMRVDPPWFIDSSEIATETGFKPTLDSAIVTSGGTWLGTAVDVVEITTGTRSGRIDPFFFVNEVTRWIPLHHPHVLRMYGACHRGQLSFIVEHTEHDSFKSHVTKYPESIWTALHQVSLGIRYLHERSVIHSGLRCSVFRMGGDGLPKVGGLGHILRLSRDFDNDFRWRAPEALDATRSTVESDVYSFGMCIFEAVTGEIPFANEQDATKVKEIIKSGQKPPRHAEFTDRAWKLVQRMICERDKRVRMADVVNELESLAREEHDGQNPHKMTHADAVGLLEKASHLCGEMGEPVKIPHLLGRLSAVLGELDVSGDQLQAPERFGSFSGLVDRFIQELNRHKNATEASQIASDRQHTTVLFSFHNELDRLVEEWRISDVGAWAAWRQAWRELQREKMALLEKKLQDLALRLERESSEDREEIDKLTCLKFELTKYRLHYSAISSQVRREVCEKIQDVLPVRRETDDWFLPWYEVDVREYLNQGGFGEVFRGRWLDSDVVFKKLKSNMEKNIQDEFMREVDIWSKLHHPHVVRLFGACHVGERVFVSEWAEHGELKAYVKKRGQVWQKLQEAALGLKYLHSRNVLHCDLKCNNILVGRDGKAKLADFGLSWLVASTVEGQQSFGNARWTAPEMIHGAPATKASDIYSFGLCIIEAVTGKKPFANFDDAIRRGKIKRGHFHERPVGKFSDAQWDLVLRCCHLEPTERASLEEILTTLEAFIVESREQAIGDAVQVTTHDDYSTKTTSDEAASCSESSDQSSGSSYLARLW